MIPGKCVFDPSWMKIAEFASWLRKGKDKHSFLCFTCSKTFDLGKMGKHAVIRHSGSDGHKKNSWQKPRTIDELIGHQSVSSQAKAEEGHESETTSSRPSTSAEGQASSSVYTPTAALKAEILWSLKVVTSHYVISF